MIVTSYSNSSLVILIVSFTINFCSLVFLVSCEYAKNEKEKIAKNNINLFMIKIANEELEYEVTIIDAGFAVWLASRAQPRNYYSEFFLENKNQFWVSEWNRRVLEPQRYDAMLYEMQINYDNNIHYGYEVNYLIYNYLVYFQNVNRQRLWGNVPMR